MSSKASQSGSRSQPSGARPGPRPRFSRDDVLATALRLIDADPDAFTMRALAEAMGMGVMTLYGYVGSKEEALEGATLLAFREAHRDPPAGAPWDEQLRAAVAEFHALCRRHPNLVALVLRLSSASPGLFRMRESMLEILRGAGFEEREALHALGVVLNYTVGFAGAQAASAPIDLPDRLRELPADEFPRLAEAAGVYEEHLSDAAFEFGLGLILDGLRRARQAA